MLKPRCELTAEEVLEMHAALDARLTHVGIGTQPAVGRKILQLVSDPGAQVHQFARAIGVDAALTGRLLKLVNSALFAQRKPVTALERACSLLGVERLKAFSLGFYLSRGASTDPSAKFSRRVWGESVLRACLASELAGRLFPGLASEAFIVGLMLDAGLPLMPRLVGGAFSEIGADTDEAPARRFMLEFRRLPFTHVDVVSVMARRWRLPDVLVRPLEWHHTPPGGGARSEPVFRLQRLAYYVGAVRLDEAGVPAEPAPLSTVAGRVLGIDGSALDTSVRRAVTEYRAAMALFSDVAQGVAEAEDLSVRVHQGLVKIVESAIMRDVGVAEPSSASRFTLGGFTVEVVRGDESNAVASLLDSTGSPLLTHHFRLAGVTPEQVIHAMGLELSPGDDSAAFNECVRAMAA